MGAPCQLAWVRSDPHPHRRWGGGRRRGCSLQPYTLCWHTPASPSSHSQRAPGRGRPCLGQTLGAAVPQTGRGRWLHWWGRRRPAPRAWPHTAQAWAPPLPAPHAPPPRSSRLAGSSQQQRAARCLPTRSPDAPSGTAALLLGRSSSGSRWRWLPAWPPGCSKRVPPRCRHPVLLPPTPLRRG